MSYLELIPESIQLVRMDDATYFSDLYKDYVSNSKLSLINPEEDGSPEKFKRGYEGGYSESYELGSAIHNMLLQPESYEIPEIRKPTGKLGLFSEYVYKYRQEGYSISHAISLASVEADYFANGLSEKRLNTAIQKSIDFYLQRMKFKEDLVKVPLFLSEPMYVRYEQCMANIASDKLFMKTLYPEGLIENPEVYNEYAILAEVKIDGKIIKVKAKLDNFTIDHENEVVTLNDLKSSGRPAAYFMGNWVYEEDGEKKWYQGSFEKYKYYRQVGMYSWLLQGVMHTLGLGDYTLKANILVVETIPEFKTRICKISKKWIDYGRKEFKNLMFLVADEY